MFDSTRSWRKVGKEKRNYECFLGGGLSWNLAAPDWPWAELFVFVWTRFSLAIAEHSQPKLVVSIMPFNRVAKPDSWAARWTSWFVYISHNLLKGSSLPLFSFFFVSSRCFILDCCLFRLEKWPHGANITPWTDGAGNTACQRKKKHLPTFNRV